MNNIYVRPGIATVGRITEKAIGALTCNNVYKLPNKKAIELPFLSLRDARRVRSVS
ncbi:MAG: hypothetical protein RM338_15545 [Nostoc sp. DedQUE12a]|nr:hypothetical protein [Nostoc sp. DedQUE12a]